MLPGLAGLNNRERDSLAPLSLEHGSCLIEVYKIDSQLGTQVHWRKQKAGMAPV